MRESVGGALQPAFDIVEPATLAAPFVFNSPHSGRTYPKHFLAASRLDALTLRRSEDAFVDELFMGVTALGVPLMRAHFPRAYLDVNREPYELDPRMFAEPLPSYANTRSLRVAGGLGTIARIVAEAEEIYKAPLPLAEALSRIETLYKPYHGALKDLIGRVRDSYGVCVLVDCHSMPSARRAGEPGLRPDFVLGDRYGASCATRLVDAAQETLRGLGYRVSRNKPYAGGYITERYGTPAIGIHTLQIEINRALYMDEERCEKSRSFERLKRDLTRLAERLMRLPISAFVSRHAAE
ncbi:MAG: N-formylglutamate amidohydrolase [Pseudomonadota bacterium]|nr:N-formylglutamate amidohydrolase [Pseudomonadota bacterium]